jgi:hypothetical protein
LSVLAGRRFFEHGKIWVTVAVGERRVDHIAFDTGAQFGLVVDPLDFEDLTGRTAADDRNVRHSVGAWGSRLEVVTAPARADVSVGGRSLGRLDIATVPAAPSTFRSVRRFPMRGLLGWPALAGRPFAVSLVAEPATGSGG